MFAIYVIHEQNDFNFLDRDLQKNMFAKSTTYFSSNFPS